MVPVRYFGPSDVKVANGDRKTENLIKFILVQRLSKRIPYKL